MRGSPKLVVNGLAEGLAGLEGWRLRGGDGDAFAGAGIAVVRAGRNFVEKDPYPAIETVSPRARASAIAGNTALKAAAALDSGVSVAMRVDSSALLICPRLSCLRA